ncbi:MAG: sigma-70 family RNA polymerase sigma factor [Gemmiger sp.]
MDDRTLIRLLRRDPDAGLRAALQGYGPLVKAILMRVLPRDPREVEEGMADAFVALWRRAAELERDRTPVRPWLAVTARHIAIDRYRALRRQNTLSLDDGLGETLADLNAFDRLGSEAEVLAGALVAGMDQPDREIFLRKYYLLQPTKEIAAALNMTVSAVNTRLSRGRDRLRRQLEEKGVHRHV